MVTINLTRREVYTFGLSISLLPLVFFAAGLFSVQFIQELQSNTGLRQSEMILTADDPADVSEASEDMIKSDLISGGAIKTSEDIKVANIIDMADFNSEANIVEAANGVEMVGDSSKVIELEEASNTGANDIAIDFKKFTVQLGSFSNHENALTFVGDLQNAGVPYRLLQKPDFDGRYIIVTGLYKNLQEARFAATQYRELHHSDAFGVSMTGMNLKDSIATL